MRIKIGRNAICLNYTLVLDQTYAPEQRRKQIMNRYVIFLSSVIIFSMLAAPVYASGRRPPVDPETFPTDKSIINVCTQIVQQKLATSGYSYPTILRSTTEIKIP